MRIAWADCPQAEEDESDQQGGEGDQRDDVGEDQSGVAERGHQKALLPAHTAPAHNQPLESQKDPGKPGDQRRLGQGRTHVAVEQMVGDEDVEKRGEKGGD